MINFAEEINATINKLILHPP